MTGPRHNQRLNIGIELCPQGSDTGIPTGAVVCAQCHKQGARWAVDGFDDNGIFIRLPGGHKIFLPTLFHCFGCITLHFGPGGKFAGYLGKDKPIGQCPQQARCDQSKETTGSGVAYAQWGTTQKSNALNQFRETAGKKLCDESTNGSADKERACNFFVDQNSLQIVNSKVQSKNMLRYGLSMPAYIPCENPIRAGKRLHLRVKTVVIDPFSVGQNNQRRAYRAGNPIVKLAAIVQKML